jgi:murein DD-endopeptidase MepM/ murein hydrolase activator NlpD
MRLHLRRRSLRTGLSIAALLTVSATLAGCVTTSTGLVSSEVTASTGARPVAELGQPMPGTPGAPGVSGGVRTQALAAVSQPGPYTPPGSIGVASDPQGQLQNRLQPPAIAQNSAARTRTALASLPTSSTPLPPLTPSAQESNATMSAQSAALQTPVSAPQNAVPAAAPNLQVVPRDAFYHTIVGGESLYAIAAKYAVTTDAIVQANQLVSADKIFVGQRLIIPGRPDLAAAERGRIATAAGTTIKPAPVLSPATAPASSPIRTASIAPEGSIAATAAPAAAVAQAMPATPADTGIGKFRWPVQGRLIADFKASKGTGINIEVPEGAAIRAAENGTVIYTGNGVEGYGNLILIRHANGFVSAYAHLKDIGVAKGDLVNRGDAIGSAGMTGGVSRPQLHFELRNGSVPVDPLPLLIS